MNYQFLIHIIMIPISRGLRFSSFIKFHLFWHWFLNPFFASVLQFHSIIHCCKHIHTCTTPALIAVDKGCLVEHLGISVCFLHVDILQTLKQVPFRPGKLKVLEISHSSTSDDKYKLTDKPMLLYFSIEFEVSSILSCKICQWNWSLIHLIMHLLWSYFHVLSDFTHSCWNFSEVTSSVHYLHLNPSQSKLLEKLYINTL